LPELAFSYSVGFLVTVALVGLNFYFQRRQLASTKLLILNENLQKIGKFWSNSQGRVLDGGPAEIKVDSRDSSRSFLILGALMCLGSWIGIFALLLTLYYLKKISVGRMEAALFSGPLVSSPNLPIHIVQAELRSLADTSG